MDTWKVNGETLAERKINTVRIHARSQAQDILTFRMVRDAADDPEFGYGDIISLKRNATQVFYGKVVTLPRAASAKNEDHVYRVAGPWWWLDEITFQTAWKHYEAGQLQTQYKSRAILGQDAAGGRQTIAGVIGEVLAFAISAGAPIQIGSTGPGAQFPFDEVVDLTCGEIIRRVLRWAPDYVAYFDHSTTPPTFHCRARSSLGRVTVNLDGGRVGDYEVVERSDLRTPAVVIFYEFAEWNEVDDEYGQFAEERTQVDAYPSGSSGRAPGSIVATVELATGEVTYVTQTLDVVEIPETLTVAENQTSEANDRARAWWTGHVEWLRRLGAGDYQIHDVARASSLQNEIVSGQIMEWMTGGEEEDLVEALIDFVVRDDDDVIVKREKNVPVTVKMRVTDATGGFYPRIATVEDRESVPTGVAQAFYNSVNSLGYSGFAKLRAADSFTALNLGYKLCLSGGAAAWESMDAAIQELVHEVDTGSTTITFGPPEHLTIQDLVERLRANRQRNKTVHFLSRTSGKNTKARSTVPLGDAPSMKNSSSGAGKTTKLRIDAGDGSIIDLDPDQVTDENMVLAAELVDDELVMKPGYVRYRL